MPLRIGTSGWSYPTGAGTWDGVFYPAPGDPARGRGRFDELAYYAEHFDTVEVNSSFYRTPSPQTTRSWVRRTPSTFDFSFKLFQKFTHPKMFTATTGGDAARPTLDDVGAFKASLDPVAQAGKLGALLAQFPASFKRDDGARLYLDWLLQAFREYPLAVELRHRSWSDEHDDTRALLASHGAAWAQIDEPKFKESIRQDFRADASRLYYVRMHGRNAARWWEHERSEDRYNYLYSDDELRPVVETIDAVRHVVDKLYLYFNNHFAAKAVANAAMLEHDLGLTVRGRYPEAFVEAYPALRGIVATSTPLPSRTLF